MPKTNRAMQEPPSLGIDPSPDGYWRLGRPQLQGMRWVHLISGLDAEPEGGLPGGLGAVLADISGYTEWLTSTAPALSLGWDWRLVGAAGGIQYLRVGEPRSNIMVLDPQRQDLGPVASALALALYVDAMPWEQTVARYVHRRYA
jgi:hypothetical protein